MSGMSSGSTALGLLSDIRGMLGAEVDTVGASISGRKHAATMSSSGQNTPPSTDGPILLGGPGHGTDTGSGHSVHHRDTRGETVKSRERHSDSGHTAHQRDTRGETVKSGEESGEADDLWRRGVDPADVEIHRDARGQAVVLGGGACAVVYLGRRQATLVAVKVMLSGNSEAAQQEVRAEAEILQSLRHPNIVLLMAICIAPSQQVHLCPYLRFIGGSAAPLTAGVMFEYIQICLDTPPVLAHFVYARASTFPILQL
jgi:hypothetical protein